MRVRFTGLEMLDGEVADCVELAHSFREVWDVNRYFGGLNVLQRHLRPWLFRRHLNVLDVAAGTGDVTCALVDWAGQNGATLSATVLDNHPQVLAIARERTARVPGVAVVQGDARRLPFQDCQFDLAICNLALHHFGDEEAAHVLQEMDRVASLGWIVTDLERHPVAYAVARVLAATVWRSPITRHDGPLSVRRAFRETEARDLVRTAGVRARVARHFPFRITITSHRL
jgi:ubiquinone/menaquinone biosynthesis C-methylase UbiE